MVSLKYFSKTLTNVNNTKVNLRSLCHSLKHVTSQNAICSVQQNKKNQHKNKNKSQAKKEASMQAHTNRHMTHTHKHYTNHTKTQSTVQTDTS